MTFGFSRDDAGKFLPSYYENKIYESDPFCPSGYRGRGPSDEDGCGHGQEGPSRPALRYLR